MRAHVLALAAASLALAAGPPAGPDDPPRPNVVLLLADDLGPGDPRFANPSSKIPTPRLDRFAREGLRFTDAHAPAAVCSPTRYGLLTGRYAFRGKLRAGVVMAWEPPILEPERLTLPEMLRSAGYRTACIGKWHLGWSWPAAKDGRPDLRAPIGGGPLAHGFDHYFGQDVPHFPPYAWIEDDHLTEQPTAVTPPDFFGDPGPMVEGWNPEGVLPALGARAVGYLRERAAEKRAGKLQPFFLFCSLTAPHTPILPTRPFRGRSQAGAYGDFVCQVDALVGDVLDALEEGGLAEDTLVIFTSDNGSPGRSSTLADIGTVRREYGHDASGGWRGLKADVWEGGHRVPLVVRWPGRIAADARCGETVCLVDWMATLASILGLELPDDAAEDSFDLSPALFGREHEKPLRGPLFHQSFHGMLAVRDGDWKLCAGLGSGGWSEPVWIEPQKDGPTGQLYDLGKDPHEGQNRFLDEPAVVERLQEWAKRSIREGRSRPRGPAGATRSSPTGHR